MNIVKYGKWEISLDVEKTKEYYQNYVINNNQASIVRRVIYAIL